MTELSIKPIGKHIDQLNGFAFKSELFNQDNSGIRLCRGINITRGKLRFDSSNEMYWDDESIDLKKYLLDQGDIVISMDGSLVGRNFAIVQNEDLPLLLVQRVARLRVKEGLSQGFLYQWIASDHFIKYVDSVKTSSGIPHISASQINEFKITFLPYQEQQKIAAILSKWDELIETQTQLITTKEKQKNSLMQKLLTGEVRFPGFEDEWKMKKLGDIGKIKMCKRIFNHQTLSEGDIPFYKIGTFGKKADAFISNELYEEYKNKFSFPLKGEILISAAGTLGRTVVYDGKPAFFQDSNIVWLSHNETKVLNRFLNFVYQTVRYESEGGTIQRLYNSIIYDVDIYLPSIEEQNKIATFLTYTDEEIRNLKTELEAMKLQKKGLMQELLTGKIRVKV